MPSQVLFQLLISLGCSILFFSVRSSSSSFVFLTSLSLSPPPPSFNTFPDSSQTSISLHHSHHQNQYILIQKAAAMTSSIYQTFQKQTTFSISSMKNKSLPVSQSSTTTDPTTGFHLRRRISSLSLSPPPHSWVFRRSKSLSSIGERCNYDVSLISSIKKWWDWGVGWISSKKPTFAKDLEMNEHESSLLGLHSKGSWRHVFYKVRSEFRRLVGADNNVGLPQTFRYDAVAYAKNFDDGRNSRMQS